MNPALVEMSGLRKVFSAGSGVFARRHILAVDDVSLTIGHGESVGLVGESGSGKSTVARLLLGLVRPSEGRVSFEGLRLDTLKSSELRAMRRHMQIVFQNPHTSLHPRMTVAQSLAEPLRIQGCASTGEIRRQVAEMVDVVGLPSAFLHRYPHELSGGQKQRICIARALMLKPKLLVLDEPTSALDVSVQAQILEFLKTLQRDLGLAYLFISHNLAVVEAMCTRVLVMYHGRVVEEGRVDRVLSEPRHPYTQRLLAATLVPDASATLPGAEVESGLATSEGCRFVSRCPVSIAGVCDKVVPSLTTVDGSRLACHRFSGGEMHAGARG
jgi:oligopeptide/dipeptide ABC transporter ATP-binding protein